MEKAKKIYPNENFPKDTHKNNGLITIDEEGIENSLYLADLVVTINLDSYIVDFNAIDEVDKKYSDRIEMAKKILHMELEEVLKFVSDIDYNKSDCDVSIIDEDEFVDMVYEMCKKVVPVWEYGYSIPFHAIEKFAALTKMSDYWTTDGVLYQKIN